MRLIRSHDALFRFVFGEPEQMAELLQARLPRDLVGVVDWTRLRRVDAAFVDKELRQRQADLLFVTRAQAAPVLLHVLAEHKSAPDPWTAWQLARCVVRIQDRWLEANPGATELPAVLPFVIHHGPERWRGPRTPRDLVALEGCASRIAASLRRWQLHLPFVLHDLAGAGEAGIERRRYAVVSDLAIRFLQLLRQRPGTVAIAAIRRWRHLFERLLEHPRGHDVVAALLSWYLASAPDAEETLHTLMTELEEDSPMRKTALDLLLEMGEKRGLAQGMQQGVQQGVQQGIEQGLVAGLRTLLADQMRARFGELGPDVVARIDAAEAPVLRAWGRRVLTAATPDEVLGGA